MSFGDLGAAGAARSSVSQPPPPIVDSITRSVFGISTSVTAVQKMLAQLGGARDTPELRAELSSVLDDAAQAVKNTTAQLKDLDKMRQDDPQNRTLKLSYEKLKSDFENTVKRYQKTAKDAHARTREYAARPVAKQQESGAYRAELEDEFGETSENQPLLAQEQLQEQQSLAFETAYHESLIIEREHDIAHIERSVLEVNEIFRDLGTLVHGQQNMLDHIEANVEHAAVNMENAAGELRTASKHQKSARQMCFWLMIILAVIVVVIVLVIFN